MPEQSRAEEVTGMLRAWQDGDADALQRLIPIVYRELHRVARARLRAEAPGHILQTTAAVIGGLVYNYLPFMILPIYVALERVDPRVVEAAQDLYATRAAAFRRVVLPLSLPGVFAGVLMTFVPATADPVNAAILGGTANTMIGNIIQTEYLTNLDYPTASALSFTLMGVLLVGIFFYARVLGTENVLEAAAR